MFKSARKGDLQLAATELGEEITEKMTVTDLINLIKNNEKCKTEPEFVSNLIEGIIEDRKAESEMIEKNKQLELQLEQIKLERAKAELELPRMKTAPKSSDDDSKNKSETCDSLDSLIKSVKTLTIRIPSRPEGWGLFFTSLERSFITKNVPDKFKAEILLNLLGEKASNVISYISDNELSEYDKVKKIVLREFQPTPQSCLEQFRKTTRQANETHVQFASRLTTSFDYYLKLREVSDFEKLKQLIVSDKMFQTLDKETASHISVRQLDNWFDPLALGKEADLFFVSRGKSLTDVNHKLSNSKNVSKIFLADSKSLK